MANYTLVHYIVFGPDAGHSFAPACSVFVCACMHECVCVRLYRVIQRDAGNAGVGFRLGQQDGGGIAPKLGWDPVEYGHTGSVGHAHDLTLDGCTDHRPQHLNGHA